MERSAAASAILDRSPDPDPASYLNTDPDPGSQINADPDPDPSPTLPSQNLDFDLTAICGPVIYTAPYVMLLMRATSITRASGRGLGPGNRDFFGPCEMSSSRQASAVWSPKKSSISYMLCCLHISKYWQ